MSDWEIAKLKGDVAELRRRAEVDRANLQALRELLALLFGGGGMPMPKINMLIEVCSTTPPAADSADTFGFQAARQDDLLLAFNHLRDLILHYQGDRPEPEEAHSSR